MNVCLINGSPRGDKAFSKKMIDYISEKMNENGLETDIINVPLNAERKDYKGAVKTMTEADAIVICYPIYVFCLPGSLMRLLEEYHGYVNSGAEYKKAIVYSVVNCGFPEPSVNAEGIRVIKNFCRREKLTYGYSISLGCGPFIDQTREVPLLKNNSIKVNKELSRMTTHCIDCLKSRICKEEKDVFFKPNIPKLLVLRGGGKGWLEAAKKNGLTEQDLYARPHMKTI